MNIVIFGGGGFIGSSMTDRLLKDNNRLRVVERHDVMQYRKFLSHEKVDWITGDFLNANDISRAIDSTDVVIHLVSTTLPKNSNESPINDVKTNLIASIQLLDKMVEMKIPKIIFISSGGTVCGDALYSPIDENHTTNPKVSYGITKLAIEKYLLLYQSINGIKVNILRVANPYGERQRIDRLQGAAATFIYNAIQGKKIKIWGDGEVVRDYIYISDVSEAIASAIAYKGMKSIFNISSSVGVSLNELAKKIEHVLNQKITVNFNKARSIDVPNCVLDNTLARDELRWAPQVNIDDGLLRTAKWFKKKLKK